MSAADVVALLANDEGSVNAVDAVEALRRGIERMHEEGVRITVAE